ncbi:hypothetical protein [uncultured Cetobacterium sp.]|uniref:hypothetical protein n=1 Tax=uncultured Cetobacterium sp. TaxID=527638 RepID=UPI0026359FFA|nr:hypothetical protein [uncultured Cetobacterium sp.]
MSVNTKGKLRQRKQNPTTDLNLTENQLAELDQIAAVNNTTRDHIIKILIAEYLKNPSKFNGGPLTS